MNYTPYKIAEEDIYNAVYHLLTLNSNEKGTQFMNNKYGYTFVDAILVGERTFAQVLVNELLFNKNMNFRLLEIELYSNLYVDGLDDSIEPRIEDIMRGIK